MLRKIRGIKEVSLLVQLGVLYYMSGHLTIPDTDIVFTAASCEYQLSGIIQMPYIKGNKIKHT